MPTTIDAGGRIVIPKHVRESLGLHPGAQVDVVERDGLVVLVPKAAGIHLVEHGKRLVAVADDVMPTLTADAVREALEAGRR